MVKIVIDAGHSMNTAGKRCLKSIDPKETREWYLNSRVANYVEEFLEEYKGYEVKRVDDRSGKIDIPLSTRSGEANKWGADIYLSIHHNAGINGGTGGGMTVYRHPNSTKVTNAVLKRIYDALIKETGLKGNRVSPLNSYNFHVLRETRMPAILIEGGFMDSRIDVPIILSDKYAREYAQGVVNWLVSEYKLDRVHNYSKGESDLLRNGSRGNAVVKLQNNLNTLGYNAGSADGIFGNNTENALKAFQKDRGLSADGIYGAKSDEAMKKALENHNNPSKDYKKLYEDLQKKLNEIKKIVG